MTKNEAKPTLPLPGRPDARIDYRNNFVFAPGRQSLGSGQKSVPLAVWGNERDQVFVVRNRKSTHRHMFIALLSCCQVQEERSSYVWDGFCDVFPLVASHWPNQLGSSFPGAR